MESSRISELLHPFLGSNTLDSHQLSQFGTYLDLLLKWNSKMSLTAVRRPEEIVTRHFGESLFAALHLFSDPGSVATLIDVGSGAGFPGIPIVIVRPSVGVTLIEAQMKKAVFLREVGRALGLKSLHVVSGRAEAHEGHADVVAFRAVERFETTAITAAGLVKAGGRLCALIGASQVTSLVRAVNCPVEDVSAIDVPGSSARVLAILPIKSHHQA